MRGKSYPYYEDWKEMFGKDRANGATAHDFGSTLDQIRTSEFAANTPPPPPGPIQSPNSEVNPENEETMSSTMPPPYVSDSQRTVPNKRKRNGTEIEEKLVRMMATYMAETKEAISELSKAISSLNEVDPAVTRVFGVLNNVLGLSVTDRVAASRKIASSRTDVAIFFSMDEESKIIFVQSILSG